MTFTTLLRLTLFALAVSLIEVCLIVVIAVIVWGLFKILDRRTGKPVQPPTDHSHCPCCKAEPPGPGSWRHPGTGAEPPRA